MTTRNLFANKPFRSCLFTALTTVLIGSVAPYAWAQASDQVVPSLCGLSIPQEDETPGQHDREKKLAMRSTAAISTQCFTSGSPAGSPDDPAGLTFFKVCITPRGNISYLESPAGKMQINGGEGYVACTFGNVVDGFDAGLAQDGWTDPIVSQPNGAGKLPLTITRMSQDARLQLTQTFTMVPGEREIQVAMTVKNNISQALSDVVLDRYFDGDLDGTAADDRYQQTADSIMGINLSIFGDGHGTRQDGLMLTQAPSPGISSVPHAQLFTNWNPFGEVQEARHCGGTSSFFSSLADFTGRLSTSLGNLQPGQSKTVTYRYRRF